MEFRKLENDQAIKLWNELALSKNDTITIAYNPHLFGFYSDFLELSPYYFFLFENEKPAGLLPIVDTGKSFISMPHLSYGGIHWLDDKTHHPSEEEQIIRKLASSVRSKKLASAFYQVEQSSLLQEEPTSDNSIEIRGFQPMFGNSEQNKLVHTMRLKKTSELQEKTYSSNLRRKISKALKNKLKTIKGGIDLVKDFSKVYNENMHRVGSPTLGENFFRTMLDLPGSNAKVFVVYLDEKPIGGSFVMWYDGYYENTWFSTLAAYNHLYTSYLLHSEMIKDAVSQKTSIYSMGRSTVGSGVQQYKLQWPVEETDLYFNSTSVSSFSLKNQKWLTKIWKRLPAVVVNRLGPVVAKRIY